MPGTVLILEIHKALVEFTHKPVKQTNKLLQFRMIGKKGQQEDILKVKSEKN